MSAHTHDLGMVIFNNLLEKKWSEDEFQNYLKKLSENSSDSDLQKAASLLINVSNVKNIEANNAPNLTLPLDIRRAVILITSDFFRKNHHTRSREMISGSDKEFYDLMNGFNLTGIPKRFANILAEIAYAHGINFYSVFERLEFESDGFGSDKMHPRFIANLLRVGDLLDVDDKRFNIFTEKVFTNNLPHSSQLHFEKHASVKHLLISPTSIEVTVDCMSDEVYRIAREWFDWLQKEVEDQSKEWTNIAPKNLIGIPPTISRDKIKILYKSNEPKKGLMNLRFEISNKKVFEMFEGSAIYEDPGFVFIREIVQNAIDASKIQLWKLINTGIYDGLIKRYLKLNITTKHEEVLKNIQFPLDLPDEIWENLQVDLKLFWNGETLNIEMLDNGTGISENDLIRMTKQVGESRSVDLEYQHMKKNIPYWLKPTGAFGIGLQSIFMVTKKFTVQTKSDYEPIPYEVDFVSSKNGEYCRVTGNEVKMSRGSKIIINVKGDLFNEIFSTSFNTDIIDNFDIFNDKYGNAYIHKVISYVISQFNYVDLLNIYVNDEVVKKSLVMQNATESDSILCDRNPATIRGENILMLLYRGIHQYDNQNTYVIYENLGIGSELTCYFASEFFDNSQLRSSNRWRDSIYLVREIPVNEHFSAYYRFAYCNIIWNFQSPESDKILNLSRSKFIDKTQTQIETKFLADIFPKIVSGIVKLFEDNVIDRNFRNATEYFHIHLTAVINNVPVNKPELIYQEYTMPEEICTRLDLKPVKFSEFFAFTKMLIISKSYNPEGNLKNESLRDVLSSLLLDTSLEADIVLWTNEYLYPYKNSMGFHKTEFYTFKQNDGVVTVYIFEKQPNYRPIKCNKEAENLILASLKGISHNSKRRFCMYPLEKYWKSLVVNQRFDSFYRSVNDTNSYIISPFSSEITLNNILTEYRNNITNSNYFLKDVIRVKYIADLIPMNLQKFVIEHSVDSTERRSHESVLEAYLDLIVDAVEVLK